MSEQIPSPENKTEMMSEADFQEMINQIPALEEILEERKRELATTIDPIDRSILEQDIEGLAYEIEERKAARDDM